MAWRLLLTDRAPGAWNMALDEALMAYARRTGDTVLRVYAWSEPTLSFGRNQTARGGYSPDRLRSHGVAAVRRPTGGRAILHHREITYAVAAPDTAMGALRESYSRINRLLVAGLRGLGVDAEVVESIPNRRASAPGFVPCFDHPSVGELVHAGRKLVGSAQWRHEGALLQHGSILVDDDQQMLSTLLFDTADGMSASPPPNTATLRGALGRAPDQLEVAQALFSAVRELEDPAALPMDTDDAITADTKTLLSRYQDDAWTWRR